MVKNHLGLGIAEVALQTKLHGSIHHLIGWKRNADVVRDVQTWRSWLEVVADDGCGIGVGIIGVLQELTSTEILDVGCKVHVHRVNRLEVGEVGCVVLHLRNGGCLPRESALHPIHESSVPQHWDLVVLGSRHIGVLHTDLFDIFVCHHKARHIGLHLIHRIEDGCLGLFVE